MTGRYETIFADALDPDELVMFATAAKTEKLQLLEEAIALTSIRERRMMLRIAALKGVEGGLTLVEEATEVIAGKEGQSIPERFLVEMEPDDADELAGGRDEQLVKVKQKRIGTLGQIQQIEQDLTAVQTHKARLIKLKHDMEGGDDGKRTPGGAGGDPDADARAILDSLGEAPEGE